MKLFICILILPCALGSEIVCPDGYICPEGTHCCKNHDNEPICCSNDNSDNFVAATNHKKAVVYSPAVEAYHFPNTSASLPRVMNTYCFKDCGLRPCCSGQCCPFIVGTCCETSCCKSGYSCCGDVSIGDTEWCCPYDKSCSTYIKGLCVGGGVSLIPSLIVMFVVSVMGMGILNTILH